jgi:hypothetical protein
LWLTNEWLFWPTLRLFDFSGIVTMIWDNGYSPCVEFLDETGLAEERAHVRQVD